MTYAMRIKREKGISPIAKLVIMQNRCLRSIIDAYKVLRIEGSNEKNDGQNTHKIEREMPRVSELLANAIEIL